MVKIGTVTLGDVPRVVIAMADGVAREAVELAFKAGADIVELRVDQFQKAREDYVLQAVSRFSGLPVLLTIRSAGEGGSWLKSESERAAMFSALLPHGDAVDIELSAREIREEVIQTARAAGKTVLGSHHNFESTPDHATLEGILEDGGAAGVDVVKIAVTCNSPEDVRVLAQFTAAHGGENIVTIGMGPRGMATRVFFPALGSLLTYTFLGEPTAPGQLNCEATLKYLKAFYPERGNSGAV